MWFEFQIKTSVISVLLPVTFTICFFSFLLILYWIWESVNARGNFFTKTGKTCGQRSYFFPISFNFYICESPIGLGNNFILFIDVHLFKKRGTCILKVAW